MAKPHGTHSIGLGAQRDDLIAKVIAAAGAQIANIKPLAGSACTKIALRRTLQGRLPDCPGSVLDRRAQGSTNGDPGA